MRDSRVVAACAVAAFLISACNLCGYREEPSQRSLAVPRGQTCPASPRPDALGSDVLAVMGLSHQEDVAGLQACCYEARLTRPAFDGEVEVAYRPFDAPCASAPELLDDPPDEVLWDLPADATLVAVVDGPTPSDGLCVYTARATRPAVDAVEELCEHEPFEGASYDLSRCMDAEAYLNETRSVGRADEKEVAEILAGPTLDEAASRLPQTECVYDVTERRTADVCG